MKEHYRIRAMEARDPRFAKIATKMGYGTRDMVAERAEPIEPAPDPVKQPDPAPEPVKTPTPAAKAEDIADVRNEYERVVGKRPFNGWSTSQLRQKMAEAKGKE